MLSTAVQNEEGSRARVGLPPAFLSNCRKPTFPERECGCTPQRSWSDAQLWAEGLEQVHLTTPAQFLSWELRSSMGELGVSLSLVLLRGTVRCHLMGVAVWLTPGH